MEHLSVAWWLAGALGPSKRYSQNQFYGNLKNRRTLGVAKC